MRIFKTVDRVFLQVEEWSLFIAVMVALFTAMANVVLRKVTSDYSLYWSDEVVRKVIFFSTYIGCAALVRSRGQIRIDALPQMFPFLKKPLTLLANLVSLFFSGVMIVLGTQMTLMMYEDEYAKTATLEIPEFYFYAILPIMGIMMFCRNLVVLKEDWTGKRNITGDN